MRSFTSKLARRAVVGIGVASVATLALVSPASAASVEGLEGTKIDTYSTWDGVSFVQPWGNPDTATYGQTITVPAGNKKVTQFSFYMNGNTGSGDIDFRAGLYSWDGQKAVKKVYESKKKTVSVSPGDEVQEVKVKVKNGKVKAGQQYVMFLSISKDYESTDPNVLAQWAAHYSDVLPGGDVVFINNGGDESQWTSTPWNVFTGFDFAMKATLK